MSKESFQPGTQLKELQILIPQVIHQMKNELIEEFGDADDFGIEGVVVVGSVANESEDPESDIDLYVLLSKPGYLESFIEKLQQSITRAIEWDEVLLFKGNKFQRFNWNLAPDSDRGKPYLTAFQVILSETCAFNIEDLVEIVDY